MKKILVTGASGELGRSTIRALLRTQPADRIAALVRDSGKATDLAQLGIDVRQGDYFDVAGLRQAFEGVDRVLLVSTTAFSDRETQHLNVIQAAKAAGVEHLVYTAIQRKAGSSLSISTVTESDIVTETALVESGLRYTILRNGLYLEVLPWFLGADVLERGVRLPGGQGTGALVARADLADANAAVLTQAGHADKVYTLSGGEAFSFSEVAASLSELAGKRVPYVEVSVEEFVEARTAAGFPKPAAAFLAEWVRAVAEGEFAEVTGELEHLIGRTPTGYREFLRGIYLSLGGR